MSSGAFLAAPQVPQKIQDYIFCEQYICRLLSKYRLEVTVPLGCALNTDDLPTHLKVRNAVWVDQTASILERGGQRGLGRGRERSMFVCFFVLILCFFDCCLKAQLRAPGNKPALGKVLFTYLSPLRMERVGRAGAMVCLTA